MLCFSRNRLRWFSRGWKEKGWDSWTPDTHILDSVCVRCYWFSWPCWWCEPPRRMLNDEPRILELWHDHLRNLEFFDTNCVWYCSLWDTFFYKEICCNAEIYENLNFLRFLGSEWWKNFHFKYSWFFQCMTRHNDKVFKKESSFHSPWHDSIIDSKIY